MAWDTLEIIEGGCTCDNSQEIIRIRRSKGGHTFDNSQENMKIVDLSSCGLDEVHFSQGKATLAKLPLFLGPIKDKKLGEFLIGVLLGLANSPLVCISLEVGGECCALCSSPVKDEIKVIVRVEHDHVLICKVNLKPDNVQDYFMDIKLIDPPGRIRRSDISSIDPPLDLILLMNLQGTTIRALVDILDRSNADCALNIDVAVE